MKKLLKRTALGAVLGLALPALTAGAYVKFDGIDGEIPTGPYAGWSRLLSFRQGMSVPVTGAGAARVVGRPVTKELAFTKYIDKSTPDLNFKMIQGQSFPTVQVLTTRTNTAGQEVPRFSYELKNVIITSYDSSGGETGEDPGVEAFSLNFEEIKVTFRPEIGDEVIVSWKVEEGEP